MAGNYQQSLFNVSDFQPLDFVIVGCIIQRIPRTLLQPRRKKQWREAPIQTNFAKFAIFTLSLQAICSSTVNGCAILCFWPYWYANCCHYAEEEARIYDHEYFVVTFVGIQVFIYFFDRSPERNVCAALLKYATYSSCQTNLVSGVRVSGNT